MLPICSKGIEYRDFSYHFCRSDPNQLHESLTLNELRDWPHPITPLINSIRESGRLASIKPDTFCPCTGINNQSSLNSGLQLTHCVQGEETNFCKVLIKTRTSLNVKRICHAYREHRHYSLVSKQRSAGAEGGRWLYTVETAWAAAVLIFPMGLF